MGNTMKNETAIFIQKRRKTVKENITLMLNKLSSVQIIIQDMSKLERF